MRALTLLLATVALAGCAEVTRFHMPDGRTAYHIDCENGLRLVESCGAAAHRVCPDGFDRLPVRMSWASNDDRDHHACRRQSVEAAAADTATACSPSWHDEGLILCR